MPNEWAEKRCLRDNCLDKLYNYRLRGRVALSALILFFVFTALFFVADSHFRAATDPTLMDLQLAFSNLSFRDIIVSWNKSIDGGIEIYKLSTILLDYFYPVIYAVMLAFAYAALRKKDQPSRLDKVIFALPFIAAVFDYIENTFHLFLLRNVHNLTQAMAADYSAWAVALSAAASTLKFTFFYAGILALLGAVACRIKKRFASA